MGGQTSEPAGRAGGPVGGRWQFEGHRSCPVLPAHRIRSQAFVPPAAGVEQGPAMDAAVKACLEELRAGKK